MVNITLAITDDIKKEMEEFPEMNWSEVARAAIKLRIELLKKVREFTSKSKMTEEDALELGRKINKSMHKRLNRLK